MAAQRLIEINCPADRLAASEAIRRRLAACHRFEPTDRNPVVFSIALRYLFDARGVEVGDYFENPRTQLEQQLLNHKWLIENMVDDRSIDEGQLIVAPDLQTIRGGYFGIAVDWFGGTDPVAVPLLHEPKDVERLVIPDVRTNLYGRKIEWFEAMQRMAGEYRVMLNDEPLGVKASVSGAGGPFPDAYALAGQNLFLWAYEAPDVVHGLMEKVTTAFINYERYTRDLTARPHRHLGLGCDAAEMLSEQMYRRFVLPYYLRCYDAFPGRRGLHMCGAIDHLIPLLVDEMKITHLNGFGSVADPHLLARHMAGRVVMSGGLDPVLLLQGPVDPIKQQTWHYLDVLAGHGGYILQDGNNVAPGTPLAHFQAVVDAADQYARR